MGTNNSSNITGILKVLTEEHLHKMLILGLPQRQDEINVNIKKVQCFLINLELLKQVEPTPFLERMSLGI